MKLIPIAAVGFVLAAGGFAGKAIHQQNVIAEARGHLDAWLEGKDGLFSMHVREQEQLFRAHCARGVTQIEVARVEWRYVEFRVWNSEKKAFLLAALKHGGRWTGTASP
jgi:hypothetical protein